MDALTNAVAVVCCSRSFPLRYLDVDTTNLLEFQLIHRHEPTRIEKEVHGSGSEKLSHSQFPRGPHDGIPFLGLFVPPILLDPTHTSPHRIVRTSAEYGRTRLYIFSHPPFTCQSPSATLTTSGIAYTPLDWLAKRYIALYSFLRP